MLFSTEEMPLLTISKRLSFLRSYFLQIRECKYFVDQTCQPQNKTLISKLTAS